MAECVLWEGAKCSGGYGMRTIAQVQRRVHVLAWEAEHGAVPEGHDVHHVCGNRACHNVEHLELVPHGEHAALHARRPRPHQRRFTDEQVRSIRRAAEGSLYTARAVAESYGVSRNTIVQIVERKTYKEVV